MELLLEPIIMSFIFITIGSASFYITYKGIRDLRKIKPIVEKEQKEQEERRAKLKLDSYRLPLYFDDESFESLYSQSQIGESPIIDQTKRVTIFESNQKLDTKIASLGTKTTKSEEHIVKPDKSKERKLVTVLNWLSDTNQLLTDINSSNVAFDAITALEAEFSKSKGKLDKDIPIDVTNALAKAIAWKNNSKAENVTRAKNKPVFLSGDFNTAQYSEKHNQFHIFSEGEIEFHVGGFIDYCTKLGKEIVSGVNGKKLRIFGYVSGIDEKNYGAVYIEAIAIHLG